MTSLSTAITNSKPHYVSINDNGTQQGNYNNDGASGVNAVAIGTGAMASGKSSSALGDGAAAAGNGATALGAKSVASGSGAVALGLGASAGAPNSVALGAGSIANEANTVSVGSQGSERRITNVAPGVNPTDAVNVSQLQGVQQSITSIARKAYGGVAAATALSMIPDVDAGKSLAVGIGGASFQGYGATAIGFTARITNNLKLRGGVGASSAGYSFGGGISYQW
ncbi:YadA family autotransporter adhesin [Burkholderia pyrrocinia]|uniref:YadA family autotransporter adhesin n=1 Tax=Burkholderia TaxID=32008 RepID=UPI001FFEC826|nr:MULTISPECIES: YadA-like family protein [Burkholderia]UVE69894.1 YadA-like family protein [Burkholderia pyrrocinia]